jgi:ubiquinone/menaquinone biosynthesis C-methylase UbiE
MPDPSKFDFKNSGNSVAEAYEELLVPRMFEPWSKLLLSEAKLSSGESVLDVACGPGTVARSASEMVGPKGKVTATDISPPMLDVARAKPQAPNSAPIEFVESPAHPLKVKDASFALTVCQQGLQFFPEKVEALKEMARVTQPGGRIAVAVWGSLSQNPIMGEVHAALQETIPSSIADLMKAPFSLNDSEELMALAREAGLKNAEVKTLSLPLVFEGGINQTIRFLEATPLAPQIAELPMEQQTELATSIRSRLNQFINGTQCQSTTVSHIMVSKI